jgi:hypothetical protein
MNADDDAGDDNEEEDQIKAFRMYWHRQFHIKKFYFTKESYKSIHCAE